MKKNKIFDEFEYTIEHESKLNSSITFLVKFKAIYNQDNEVDFTDISFIDSEGRDITALIQFGWEYDCETIQEEICARAQRMVEGHNQERRQYKLHGQTPY